MLLISSASAQISFGPGGGGRPVFTPLSGSLTVSELTTISNIVASYVASYISPDYSVIESSTRYGGALTNINIVLNEKSSRIFHVNGATNVNVEAIMNWTNGYQKSITFLVTNRTATPRTLSLGALTNNFIALGSLTAPQQITNALWVTLENLGTSNTTYAIAYAANPTN